VGLKEKTSRAWKGRREVILTVCKVDWVEDREESWCWRIGSI
jgi:hypothetical protein